MNRGFDLLAAAYRDRLAALETARAQGRPVVGYVGNTVPVELIAASGALPLRIAPVDGSTARADAYVESFADPDARLIFARYVEGTYDGLALLVLPRSSESWHKLYLALREADRTGLERGGPPLWLHDVLHTQRESSRRYGLARTGELARQLAAAGARLPDAAALRAAIAQGNRVRRLLQQLQALRLQGRVSGEAAQVATGGLRFMDPTEGEQALAEWLAGLAAQARQTQAATQPRPRLFVHGVPLDHAALHGLADELGACIVAEDDDWGSRAAAPLIDEAADPSTAIFEHYWRDVPCLRIHPPPPGPPAFVGAWQRRAIDGVLFNLPRPDDLHGWRFPADRAAADAVGVPWLLLRDDARDRAARPGLQRALQDFVRGLAPQTA